MKTIKQIADEIGVSRQAVYDKIKKEPLSSALNGLTEKVDRTLHIKLDGIKLIKSAFDDECSSSVSSKEFDNVSKVLIETLQQQISTLTKQLEVKDNQLEIKDNQILNLTETNKNLSENINSMKDIIKNAQTLHAKDTILPQLIENGENQTQKKTWKFWQRKQ